MGLSLNTCAYMLSFLLLGQKTRFVIYFCELVTIRILNFRDENCKTINHVTIWYAFFYFFFSLMQERETYFHFFY